MKTSIYFAAILLLIGSNLFGQITFDYSAFDLVLEKYTQGRDNDDAILNSKGYQIILEHSTKYSSNPLTKDKLRNSLNGKNEGFDFSHVAVRKQKYVEIIKFLKDNEQDILNIYANLCKKYLPDDYHQKATIRFVIGGYNGIAFDNEICMNIDFEQFRNNYKEIELYVAHELFHIGFEKYQALPDIFKATTVRDLKKIVLMMTMNEGLATLTPYHKRVELNEMTDKDYKFLTDSITLQKKIEQFNSVLKFIDENINAELTNEILGNVLGQCSGDRLFYIVGCYMGLKIEEKYGSEKIQELVKQGPDEYFETFRQISEE